MSIVKLEEFFDFESQVITGICESLLLERFKDRNAVNIVPKIELTNKTAVNSKKRQEEKTH